MQDVYFFISYIRTFSFRFFNMYELCHCVCNTGIVHCKDTIPNIEYSKQIFQGIARPRSQFLHLCVCERFKYSHDRSAIFVAGKYVDRSWEYINRSQTHECGNSD